MYGGQTGYTYDVAEGKITSGAEFLKLCARAFGACGIFRDESFDTPLEELIKKTWNKDGSYKDYYKTHYDKAIDEYNRFASMSNEERKQMYMDELNDRYLRELECLTKMKTERKRFDKVLKEVNSWNPPTSEHESIKNFAIDQIGQVIAGDSEIEQQEKIVRDLEFKDFNEEEFQEWKKNKIEHFEWDINYYESHEAKEKSRYDSNYRYLKLFLDSLNEQFPSRSKQLT